MSRPPRAVAHGKQVKILGRHAADAATENDAKVIAKALENYFQAPALLMDRTLS